MDCKHIENQLYDYHDGQLPQELHEEVATHLKNCTHCQNQSNEVEILMKNLDLVSDIEPNNQLENAFLSALNKEKELNTNPAKKEQTKTISLAVFKYAAILLLMLSCYYAGYYININTYKHEVASLMNEKTELKSLMTVSLIENESASKRIQGLHFAQELTHPKDEILNVLFNKMKYDEHISVRLASAQALKKFSNNDSVVHEFIKTLEVEENPTMQLELIEILSDIKEKRAIPILKKLLEDQKSPEYVKEQIQLELNYLI